ncbi:hypothetical protein [Bergeyella porcorum]|uniref:hypothetical protein n=1 Tax=Bergeyella porcorum TaxID=1735111 RepID=UPI002E210544
MNIQMGTITAIVYILAVGTQVLILGKGFKIRQLLQIPYCLYHRGCYQFWFSSFRRL